MGQQKPLSSFSDSSIILPYARYSLQCGDKPWAFVAAVTLYTASRRTYLFQVLFWATNRQKWEEEELRGFLSESVPFCGNGNCEVAGRTSTISCSVSMVTTIPEQPQWATATVFSPCPHCSKVGSTFLILDWGDRSLDKTRFLYTCVHTRVFSLKVETWYLGPFPCNFPSRVSFLSHNGEF